MGGYRSGCCGRFGLAGGADSGGWNLERLFWNTSLREGLNRLETRLRTADNPAGEWSPRGIAALFGGSDLWVIAGQSNSAGYGRGPSEDPVELGVHLFRNSEHWALAAHPMNESTDTQHAVNREAANPGHFALPAIWADAQKDAHAPGGFGTDGVGRVSAHSVESQRAWGGGLV